MKAFVLALAMILCVALPLFAQSANEDSLRVGYFIGSLRTPYASLGSGIDLVAPGLAGLPLSFEARLQSIGTLLALNPMAFDLEAAILYGASSSELSLAAGIGYKLWARFISLTDIRSTATTMYAPFLRGEAKYRFLDSGGMDLDLGATLDAGLFSDGFALRFHPRLSFGIEWFFVALDLDAEFMARAWGPGRSVPDYGFYWDSWIMVGLRLRD